MSNISSLTSVEEPKRELQRDQNGELLIYGALGKIGHELRDQAMRPEAVADVCLATGGAIEKLIAALPFYADLVNMDPATQALKHMDRAGDHAMFSIALRTLVREHKRVCTGFNGGASDNATSTLGLLLSGQNPKSRTPHELANLLSALPMANMVNNIMERQNRDVLKTIEFKRREEEMQSYVEQVRKYGLADGGRLQEPKEGWMQEPKEVWRESSRRQFEELAKRSDTAVQKVTIKEFMKR